MKTFELFNKIKKIGKMSYLELGIGNGLAFAQVNAKRKDSVDINGKAKFTGTTDEFFQSITARKKWDLVYIDANHDFTQLANDFNGASEHCNEWIAMHDMIPPSERYTASRFCSDSYRLLWYLWEKRSDIETYTLNDNFGLTFVRMPVEPLKLAKLLNWYHSPDVIGYPEFVKEVAEKKLYSESELLKVIEGRQK